MRTLRLLLSLACLFVLFAVTNRADPTPAPLTADTMIMSECQNWACYVNWGDRAEMFVGWTPDNGSYRALLQFDLSAIPRSASIISAHLQANLTGINSGERYDMVASVHRLTSSWTESWATGSRMGSAWDPKVYDSKTLAPNSFGWIEWDVTQLVREWHRGTFPNYGLMIRGAESAPLNFRVFRTKETGQGARLLVEWAFPTATPTTTSTPTITPRPTQTATPTLTPTATSTPSAQLFLPLIVRP